MGKVKMGHDHRKTELGQDLIKGLRQAIDTDTQIKEILEQHAGTLRKLAEAEKAEMKPLVTMLPSCNCECNKQPPVPTILEQKIVERTEIVKEVSKVDKRARQYSKAVRLLLNTAMKREEAHSFGLASQIQDLKTQVETLEARKPQEKQIVTEKVVEVSKTPTMVYGLLALSLALNVLILFIK